MENNANTYAETKGEAAFNWFEALDNALKNGTDLRAQRDLELKSQSWVTCACGNLCAGLPRFNGGQWINDFSLRVQDGEPVDRELSRLGIDFAKRVAMEQWQEAIDTLEQIEVRSTYLLNR